MRSSTRVMLASSSVSVMRSAVDVAMAIRGMRHLPPTSNNARNTDVVHLGATKYPSPPRVLLGGDILRTLLSNVLRLSLFPPEQFQLESCDVVLPAGEHRNGIDQNDPAGSSVTRQPLSHMQT